MNRMRLDFFRIITPAPSGYPLAAGIDGLSVDRVDESNVDEYAHDIQRGDDTCRTGLVITV